jgi:hypothetical protein
MNEEYFALRLITFNVFQPSWLSAIYGRLLRISGSKDRDARFIELCNNLHSYDVCCLQECHNELIIDKLQTFNVYGVDPMPDSKISRTTRSYHYNGSNGGLVTAVRKDMKTIWSYNYKFTYCADEDTYNRSVSFTLINMNSYWTGKYLLLCNLHLYGDGANGNTAHIDNIVREQQRSEIYGQLLQIHEKQLFPLGFTWDKCGVLICGCFNAAATIGMNVGLEYRKILESFGKARDLTPPNGNIIRTFDTDRNPYASKKRMNDTSRMDFILVLDTIVCDRGTTPTLPLKAEHIIINTDLTISDHYPVCANIYPCEQTNTLTYLPNSNKTIQFNTRNYLPQIPTAPPLPNIWEEYTIGQNDEIQKEPNKKPNKQSSHKMISYNILN